MSTGGVYCTKWKGISAALFEGTLWSGAEGHSVQQLTRLHREACRVCGSIRHYTNPHCGVCGCATALRKLRRGDKVPELRKNGGSGGSHVADARVDNTATVDGDVGPLPDSCEEVSLSDVRAVRVSPQFLQSWVDVLQGCLADTDQWGAIGP
eukprot:5339008-Amphidinium_carterae.4